MNYSTAPQALQVPVQGKCEPSKYKRISRLPDLNWDDDYETEEES